MANIWEVVIKKNLGKLDFPDNLDYVLKENNFKDLPITVQHVLALDQLPSYHKDSFDRILIAQAKCEKLTLMTADEKISLYELSYLKM